MTPLLCWVFLLALVGRSASVPSPLVNDACALVCNPGAETEGERERRERDPIQYPRYAKGVCKLQSSSDQDQAKVLVSHCLKLCAYELSDASELNCFVIRSSLESHLGCYCPALVPLSPNTMRLHENWRITHLVNELAQDLVSAVFPSPIEQGVICELHQEVFKDNVNTAGVIGEKCRNAPKQSIPRFKRDTEEGIFMDKMRDTLQREEMKESKGKEKPAMKMQNEPVHELVDDLEEDEQQMETVKFGEFMDFSRYCHESCRSNKPDTQCDCDSMELGADISRGGK